jgi:YD repeat-containing protein
LLSLPERSRRERKSKEAKSKGTRRYLLQQTYMTNHYSQTYNIDRYGNVVCTTGSNYCNNSLTFSATTNRITTSGYTYDAAGNLTADGTGYGTHTFQWDAEGRMVSVDGVAGQACPSPMT